VQITCKAMCKMLLSLESGHELEMLQKEVSQVCEAMLAFPLRLPWTRFYKGLQVNLLIKKPINLKIGLPSHQWAI
jgi:hypothetical protein